MVDHIEARGTRLETMSKIRNHSLLQRSDFGHSKPMMCFEIHISIFGFGVWSPQLIGSNTPGVTVHQ